MREWEGEWEWVRVDEAERGRGFDWWGWESERGWVRLERQSVKFKKSPIRNRVLQTRFLGGFHVSPHQIAMSQTNGNRVFKTRFPDGCQVARTPH